MQEQDRRLLQNQLKIPDIKFPDINDKMDFKLESQRLLQANALLSTLIKESLLEKYSIQERVQYLNEYIKKIQTQSKEVKFPFK